MSDISHIGIAVENLDEAIKLYTDILGHGPTETTEVADQKVKVAMFASPDDPHGPRIELLEATSHESPIKKFIDKKGPGLHHMAVIVDNIEKRLEELKGKGYRLIDEKPRIGAEGKKIAFVHPKSSAGVLLELQEK